jgi:UDP-2,3-diacylglucosamine pyrophosphatase LpxH
MISDEEFIAVWQQCKCSPSVVARKLNVQVREVYRRRKKMADRGIVLETHPLNPQGGSQTTYTQSWSYTRERQAEVIDGHVIIFSDAHFWPGGRTVANEALLKLIKRLKPARIIANGDIFDGARISRHDPHGWGQPPSVKEELDACLERMHEIALAAQRGTPLDWNIGNHDARFDRAMVVNAAEYEGVVERLADRFPEWEMAWSIRLNGSVMVKHRQANGIHAAYNNTLKGGLSMVTGHLHRLAITPWADYTGRRWGVDTGTLSDPLGPQFEYLENNATPWCSGFAVLTFKDGMLLPPELCEVIDGVAYFRGDAV